MNIASKITTTAWILAACAFFLAWRMERAAAIEGARAQVLNREIAAGRTREIQPQERVAASRASKPEYDSPARAARNQASDRPSGGSLLEVLRSDPSAQNRFLAYERSGFSMTYGPLFRQLGLSEQEIVKFEDILAQRSEGQMDLQAAIQMKGLAYNDPAIDALRTQQNSEFEAAQKALLGDDGYAQFMVFDQSIPARMAVAGIAGSATLSGIPLTPDQMQKLTDLAVQSAQGNLGSWSTDSDGSFWSAIDSNASAFLTTAQSELMKSGEFLGPQGYGTRYQGKLNALISLGFQSDAASSTGTGGSESAGAHSAGPP